MSVSKKFLRGKRICRVSFILPASETDHAREVSVVGDFNDWKPGIHLLKKGRNGVFACTVDLPAGKEYQYRYLVDKYHWETDWEADDLAATPYEEIFNSVVRCIQETG